MRRGCYKYVCLDCKAETWFERRERIRAAGLKCSACGSRFVEPSASSDANTHIPAMQDAKNDQDEEVRRKQGLPR